jgi:hypothetical protein
MPGKNIIQKTILDLQFNGRHDGFALQQAIGEWCRTDLVHTLGDQIDQLDVGNTVVKIDSLEIDVTVEDGAHWMNDVLSRIAQQLAKKSTEALKRNIAPERNTVLAFMHFLRYGALPWWSDMKHYGELLDRLEAVTLETGERIGFLELTRQLPVRKRLALLPDTSFYRIITGIVPAVKDVWNDLQLRFQDVTKANAPRLAWIIKDSILEHIGVTNPDLQATRIIATFKKYSGVDAEDSSNTRLPRTQSEKSKTQDRQEDDKHALHDRLITDGLYISDAGLVIVAPFLPALFVKTGILHNGAISDVSKAVCLVHYLGTGRESISEPELGLAKILCGLNPDDVVDTTPLLEKVLKEEALNVLASIIEHWSILKNTSVGGLQASFLQREGKLTFQAETWQLRVVQQPYDMLLQHLPWNISMIKLSWMPYMLTSEWVF